MTATVFLKNEKYSGGLEFKTICAAEIRDLVEIAIRYGKFMEIVPDNEEAVAISRGEKFLADLEKIDRGEI